MSIATDTNRAVTRSNVIEAFTNLVQSNPDIKGLDIQRLAEIYTNALGGNLSEESMHNAGNAVLARSPELAGAVGNNIGFLDRFLNNVLALAGEENSDHLTFERDLAAEAEVTRIVREIKAECKDNPEINRDELAHMLDYRGVPELTDAVTAALGNQIVEPGTESRISAANQYVGPDRTENRTFILNSDAGNVLAAHVGLAPGTTLSMGSPA